MWFTTAAMAVFALGQIGMLVAMVRIRRAKLPSTPEGRKRANRLVVPWLVAWVVCAVLAAALIVVGDPGMLIFMSAIVLFGGILLATAFVVGRRMERESDEAAVEKARQ